MPTLKLICISILCTYIQGVHSIFDTFDCLKDQTYCRLAECCNERSIPADIEGLKSQLSSTLFGQHIVQEQLIPALEAHFSEKSKSKKPLVMSFHGTAGTGKNFVVSQIVNKLFANGLKSKFVHKYYGRGDFPLVEQVNNYSALINREVREGIAACPRSLFIFDEVDEMPPGIFKSLTSLMRNDYFQDGRDNTQAIFIFISNIGGVEIAAKLDELMKDGTLRDDTNISHFEQTLRKTAYNSEGGGLYKTSLIGTEVIDHFIPFLPLEISHVYKCLKHEFALWSYDAKEDEMEDFIKNYITYDRDYDIFVTSGCKRVEKKVAVLVNSPSKWAYNSIFKLEDQTYCRLAECCNERSIPADIEGLKSQLSSTLFGQHIVQEQLIPALEAHFSEKSKSKKPLVMSFHGTTGTGKNFVVSQIVNKLFVNGLKSKFVHKYDGRVDFPLAEQVANYSALINQEVREGIADCPRSLFIFDNVDVMPPGIFKSLISLVGYDYFVDGRDNTKAIFIFISNAGGVQISEKLDKLMKGGTLRDDTKLSHFEEILEKTAYNMYKTSLIEAEIIDHFIPFLPLEISHIHKCLKHEFALWNYDPREDEMEEIFKSCINYDRAYGIFVTSGCKRMEKKVAVLVNSRSTV